MEEIIVQQKLLRTNGIYGEVVVLEYLNIQPKWVFCLIENQLLWGSILVFLAKMGKFGFGEVTNGVSWAFNPNLKTMPIKLSNLVT